MSEEKLPTRKENFAEWYNQLVVKADMADYAPVRGCMVVNPTAGRFGKTSQPGWTRRVQEDRSR